MEEQTASSPKRTLDEAIENDPNTKSVKQTNIDTLDQVCESDDNIFSCPTTHDPSQDPSSSSNSNNNNDERSSVTPIDRLLQMNETQPTLNKLKGAGIYTVESLVAKSKEDVYSIKGISELKATTLLQKARSLVDIMTPVDGAFMLKQSAEAVHIRTGSKELDKLLEGGVLCGCITEFEGEYRTGKSQLCMSLSVMCQLPSGNEGKAFYLDTYGKFSAQRVASMAQAQHCDVQTALANIAYMRIFNVDQLLDVLTTVVPKYMAEEKYALLVVDSIINLYMASWSGQKESEKAMQTHLRKVLHKLNEIACIYGVAVVITNEVEECYVDSTLFKADIKKPLGSHIVSHAVHTRIQLRKGRNENRIAKIVSDPALPEAEAVFAIGVDGIQDSTS